MRKVSLADTPSLASAGAGAADDATDCCSISLTEPAVGVTGPAIGVTEPAIAITEPAVGGCAEGG